MNKCDLNVMFEHQTTTYWTITVFISQVTQIFSLATLLTDFFMPPQGGIVSPKTHWTLNFPVLPTNDGISINAVCIYLN